MDYESRLKQHKQDILQEEYTRKGEEIRCKLQINSALDWKFDLTQNGLTHEGHLHVVEPNAKKGTKCNFRLERFTMYTNMDMKQLFNDDRDEHPAVVHINGAEKKLILSVHDLPSLINGMKIGSYFVDEKYHHVIHFTKSLLFNSWENEAPIQRWYKALGLTPHTTYPVGHILEIDDDKVLIKETQLFNLIMDIILT